MPSLAHCRSLEPPNDVDNEIGCAKGVQANVSTGTELNECRVRHSAPGHGA